MRRPTELAVAMMTIALGFGCGHDEGSASDELSHRQQSILVDNGQQHNSPELTDTRERVAYVDLTLGSLAGFPLKAASLQGQRGQLTELTADHPNGTRLRGDALIGAIFEAVTEKRSTVRVRIDSAYSAPPGGYEYGISVLAGSEPWQSLCHAGPAIAVSGYWDATAARVEDPRRVTLACRNSAVYKCARNFKLSPGMDTEDTAYHQACVRMIRGDYCGDGTTHTMDGVRIDAYDRRAKSPSEQPVAGTMRYEAAWTPHGAHCLSDPRFPLNPAKAKDQCALRIPRCDFQDFTSFNPPSDVLWMNRSHYQPLPEQPPPPELTELEKRLQRKTDATQCRLYGTSCEGLPPKTWPIPAVPSCKPGAKFCSVEGTIDRPAPSYPTPVYPAANGKLSRWQ